MTGPKIKTLPKFQIMELFGPTIQGEGLMTGTVTHFLRTGGCGLRCSWCDSMFAVDPQLIREHRRMLTIPEIHRGIQALGPAPYVTLTGGDPAIQDHLGDLIINLNFDGYKVAIETQGMFFPDWLAQCDVITFSPKGPSSGNVVDIEPLVEWLRGTIRSRVCIKVVVFGEPDFEYALDLYDQLHPRDYNAFYVTAGTPLLSKDLTPRHRVESILETQSWLADRILKQCREGTRFNDKFHVGCQQHVLLWPHEDRGV